MAFTFFFRDAQALEVALDHLLPVIQGQAAIPVWDAGCAHGPEPYTLAILLRERMTHFLFRNVRIHATDIDESFGPKVATGVFARQDVGRIPPEILRKYFEPANEPGFVQVIEELRSRVSFARHDLLSLKPVRDGFSLIVCKNVLLHLEAEERCRVLEMFHRALRSDGLLVLENTQKLPERLADWFEPVSQCAQVLRKQSRSPLEHVRRNLHPHVPSTHLSLGPAVKARAGTS